MSQTPQEEANFYTAKGSRIVRGPDLSRCYKKYNSLKYAVNEVATLQERAKPLGSSKDRTT